MRYIKAKLFYDNEKSIKSIQYDESKTDYYSFVCECRKKGMHQIIVSSEMMIDVLTYFYTEFGYKLSKIEFMEEDRENEEDAQRLINSIEENPYKLIDLLEYLKYVAEKSSIEIKRIYIKNTYGNSVQVNFFIQANGIIGINSDAYQTISSEIDRMMARFFGQ